MIRTSGINDDMGVIEGVDVELGIRTGHGSLVINDDTGVTKGVDSELGKKRGRLEV